MSDPETLAVYDMKAADYAARTDRENRTDKHLTDFIAACPVGAHVLDLGCGPGVSAAIMASAGLMVEAIDASPEMVALASTHPGVSVRLGEFDSIEEHQVFDGIWANFSLLHAPRADFPRHLEALHRALKPGGMFHIGMKTGSGESRDGLGRFYAYYTEEELAGYLTNAGFTVLNRSFDRGAGLDGEMANLITMTARA